MEGGGEEEALSNPLPVSFAFVCRSLAAREGGRGGSRSIQSLNHKMEMEGGGEEEAMSKPLPQDLHKIEMEGGGEEEEAISKPLPQDLVERIVAMMPLPFVFKSQALSKSWLSKFSPVIRASPTSSSSRSCSQKDDRLANERASFQRQLSEWAKSNWLSFCPIFLGKDSYLAYDCSSHSWRSMPSLSYLPENLVSARGGLQIQGALLYGFARPETRTGKKEMYVANILTRSWKQLPPRPNASISVGLCNKLLLTECRRSSTSKEGESPVPMASYKLVVVCREHRHYQYDRYSTQIYDSETDEWSSTKLIIPTDFFRMSTSALLDGVLYMVGDTCPQNLLAFNVNDRTFEVIRMPYVETMRVIGVTLLGCNGRLLLIVTEGFQNELNQLVLCMDVEAREIQEVARGPPAHLNMGAIHTRPVCDGNCIFFGVEEDSSSRVLAYNVVDKEWSAFPSCLTQASAGHPAATGDWRYMWIPSSFRPGLLPFAAV